MKNLIESLSPEARKELEQFSGNSSGVISVQLDTNTQEKNELNYGRLFRRSSKFGRYYIRVYDNNKKLLKTYLLINSINGDDSGNLIGFLIKQAKDFSVSSFLFKSHKHDVYSELQNPNVSNIKYDLRDKVVKLESLRSNHSRYTIKW